jgi:hypothetical protein
MSTGSYARYLSNGIGFGVTLVGGIFILQTKSREQKTSWPKAQEVVARDESLAVT